jgi:hypothetical protein
MFLAGGGEDIRDLPLYLNAQAEHLLDWFHLTMRIIIMAAMAKSLRPSPPDPEFPDAVPGSPASEVAARLQRLKLARRPAPGCYRCRGIAGHRHCAAGSSTEAWL